MGVAPLAKWPTEDFTGPWPREIRMDEATKAREEAVKRWKEFGLE